MAELMRDHNALFNRFIPCGVWEGSYILDMFEKKDGCFDHHLDFPGRAFSSDRTQEEALHLFSLLPFVSRFSVSLVIIDRSCVLLLYFPREHEARVKNVVRRRTEKDDISQDPSDPEQPAYVTLLTVQREVGITRGTLKKYLAYLGIQPICFHIGTRSLYISQEAMTQVKRLKENPAMLAHLPSSLPSPGSQESDIDGDEKRKDSSDAL